jgi:16S rRNA C967 or C1407 C5-methylase (RsmB/RsmF family)
MNGGSIVPVLALDIREGDRVLDMCSSPGGKALTALLHQPKLGVCVCVCEVYSY